MRKIRDKAAGKLGIRWGNYVKTALSAIVEWGIEYGYTRENPAKDVKNKPRPKDAPQANRPWADFEREAVIEALPAHMLPPVMLMMYYGLDPQDALKLPRSALSNGDIITRRGKTGIAVALPLLPDVAQAMANQPQHDAITLCANSYGRPWTTAGFRASWRPIRMALEEQGKVQPGLTLKGLRHTVATILREMGKDYASIQLVLGQNTEAMARHYSRRADMREQTAGAMADFEAEVNRRKTKNVKPE